MRDAPSSSGAIVKHQKKINSTAFQLLKPPKSIEIKRVVVLEMVLLKVFKTEDWVLFLDVRMSQPVGVSLTFYNP